MKTILVVDDEQHISELIKFNLENNGYKVLEASNGIDAIDIAHSENLDLILLDLMIPEIDGIEVCKTLKNNKSTKNIPIIMITAKSEETDKILGLEIGADDYITKPFSIRELLARAKVAIRRNISKIEDENNVIEIEDIVIDFRKHEVSKAGEKVDMTLKEFELFSILAKNRGKVLSRNYLLDEIWGYDYFGETRTVDVHVRHIRKKIDEDRNNSKYIETVRGVGYKVK